MWYKSIYGLRIINYRIEIDYEYLKIDYARVTINIVKWTIFPVIMRRNCKDGHTDKYMGANVQWAHMYLLYVRLKFKLHTPCIDV